jgi:TRAP-type C4-dicarboxylate transport system permease small subunit
MYQTIEKWGMRAAAVLMFGLMTLTFVDVLGRNLFNRPVNGTAELTEIGLALIIFLMLPSVTLRGQHIVIDLVDHVSGPRTQSILHAVGALLGLVMFALISWQVWVQGNRAMSYEDLTPSLRIPLGPVLYGMAAFAAVNAFAYALALSNALRMRPFVPVDPDISEHGRTGN